MDTNRSKSFKNKGQKNQDRSTESKKKEEPPKSKEGKPDDKQRQKVPIEQVECFSCKKKGHFKKNCPDRSENK